MPHLMFGMDIDELRIYLTLIQIGVTVIFLCVGRWFVTVMRSRTNPRYDRFTISRTIKVWQGPGKSLIKLRNVGGVQKFEDAVRGNKIRRLMIAAGQRCTLEQPFPAMRSDALQEEMFDAVRNALIDLSKDGEKAEMVGCPVAKKEMLFAITATDKAGESVKIFRALPIDEKELAQYLVIPPGHDWQFESGRTHYMRRVQNLALLADAHFNHNGRMLIDGKMRKVIDRFELTVPC